MPAGLREYERNVPLDEKAAGFYFCRMFFLSRRRNAWHSTRIRDYSLYSMFVSFADAKWAAEQRRSGGQGSSYLIEEIPALVIKGVINSLVVTEINRSARLRCLRPIKLKSPTLDQISNHVHLGDVKCFSVSIATEFKKPSFGKPFAVWKSLSQGTAWSLSWLPVSTVPYEWLGLTRLVRQLRTSRKR